MNETPGDHTRPPSNGVDPHAGLSDGVGTPPGNWLPGLLAGHHAAVNGAVCSLNYAEVYPAGFLAQLSIRMRGGRDRRQHETQRRQVEAAAHRSPLSGPRLVLKQQGAVNSYGTLLGFEDRGGTWILNYWFIHHTLPVEVVLHLGWSEAGIDVTYTMAEPAVEDALTAIEDLSALPWAKQETEPDDTTDGRE